jgi:hypothetical protein
MTDDTQHETSDPGTAGAPADETFAWSAEPESSSTGGGQAREWLTQLQGMIENLATQAAPVVREVGIKAAELAAIAGEKAGPVAHRAAELTGQAGQKLAERSRDLAADLRRDQTAKDITIDTSDASAEGESSDEKPTAGVA